MLYVYMTLLSVSVKCCCRCRCRFCRQHRYRNELYESMNKSPRNVEFADVLVVVVVVVSRVAASCRQSSVVILAGRRSQVVGSIAWTCSAEDSVVSSQCSRGSGRPVVGPILWLHAA